MAAGRARLWFTWSRRDLRRRWLLVTGIAAVLAIGTGTYAGLGGSSAWRIASQDASYAALRTHDVRVTLSTGGSVPAGALAAAVTRAVGANAVVQERLAVDTQVDGSRPDRTVLVPGRLVGADRDVVDVDRIHLVQGAGPSAGSIVVESKFAAYYDLPATGTVRVAGGRTLNYGGLGYGPDEFLVRDQGVGIMGESSFAVLYGSLAEAQAIAGLPGQVNEAVVRLPAGADRAAAARTLTDRLPVLLPEASAAVQAIDEDRSYRALYKDASNDEKTWNVFAGLVLLAATFAAFNLISRIVEAERREIGVGMALGATPARLAVRPLLVGLQVALMGVVGGIGVGWLVGQAFASLLRDVLPLPIWLTPFPTGRFLQAAALGLVLPVIATVIPVWRAVRVEPVEAIRAGGAFGAASRGGPITRALGRLPVPGRRVTTAMPFRNVVRAPRRSLLTIAGIGIAITALVAVLGALDTWLGTVSAGEAEVTRMTPDRVVVNLDRFRLVGDPAVVAIAGDRAVAQAEPMLRLVGLAMANGREVSLQPEVVDLSSRLWAPSLQRPVGDAAAVSAGLVLSAEAAHDLGVTPGQTVVLRHPQRTGLVSYRQVDSTVTVTAVHPNPLRWTAYLDRSQASLFGLDGVANALQVRPAAGVTEDGLKQALFARAGVGSVEPVRATARAVRELLDTLIGVFRILQGAVVALAALIAFNSASISADERARDEATMFAFGVPVRTVLGVLTVESVVLGLAGTAVGLVAGRQVLGWMVRSLLADTAPDIALHPVVTSGTVVLAIALGAVAVTVAPLFTVRRLRAMDIPSTLRVLE